MAQGTVTLENVTCRFGDVVAVDNLSLKVEAGQFFSLLGPSGCGKTTLLRMIAGFEKPAGGEIYIGGQKMTKVPAKNRPTAMVFQHYALFPNMTVEENVSYGLKVKKLSRADIREKVDTALKRVGLQSYASRPVPMLSGGQQQRVALARALAVEPDILLFDEPLSNLDEALREQTRYELRQLQRRLGTTSIYVTHDQHEALSMSDQIAVMSAGKLQQVGSPEVLYNNPETAFVADFLGSCNIISDPEIVLQLTQEYAEPCYLLAVRQEHFDIVAVGTPASLVVKFEARYFLGNKSIWLVSAGESGGAQNKVQIKILVDPSLQVPEEFSILAREFCWVKHNEFKSSFTPQAQLG